MKKTDLTRLSVNLTPRAANALTNAMAVTGDSKTDVVNRALTVYDFIEQLHARGGRLFTQEPEGELQQLRIL